MVYNKKLTQKFNPKLTPLRWNNFPTQFFPQRNEKNLFKYSLGRGGVGVGILLLIKNYFILSLIQVFDKNSVHIGPIQVKNQIPSQIIPQRQLFKFSEGWGGVYNILDQKLFISDL